MIGDQVACWRAVVARNAAADGRFVYAVVTTGIYCRPSCPTPTPHQRNVRFFSDSAAAEAAGFRACKRCRPSLVAPLAWQTIAVGKACTILDRCERPPSLTSLATAVGVSRFHFHRIFKAVLGTTPGEYAQVLRWRRLTDGLAAGHPVAEAIYGAGYGSVSRAYTKAREGLGMTPSAWRAGGAGREVRFTVVERGAGHVLVATIGEGVCTIELGGDRAALVARLRQHLPAATIKRHPADATAHLIDAVRRADLPPSALELPPEIRDTAFRARLRKALREGLDARLPTDPSEPARSASTPTRTGIARPDRSAADQPNATGICADRAGVGWYRRRVAGRPLAVGAR